MKKLLLSFLTMFLIIGSMVGQTTIYVSAFAGDDSKDGNSWNTAYKTIDAALDRISLSPGAYDVKVAQGRYIFEDNEDELDNNVPNVNGIPNQYRLYGNQFNITIEGGYRTPVNGESSHDSSSFISAFDTQDGGVSAFRFMASSTVTMSLKDLTIINARPGDDSSPAFLRIDNNAGSKFFMNNVTLNEWDGGGTNNGKGFMSVESSTETLIRVENSFIQRNQNTTGRGQFIRAFGDNKDLDIIVTNSIFRNVRGGGSNAALFDIVLDCSDDEGFSSIEISDSEFYNTKRGLSSNQSAALIKVVNLPLLELTNNKFQGNAGGNGAVLDFQDSGQLISNNNTYQDNFGGYAGIIYVHGFYGGNACSAFGVSNDLSFTDDKFFSNRSGYDGLNGRGAALLIANSQTGSSGASSLPKKLTITNCDFNDNHTQSASGGALFVNTSEDVTITDSRFCDNESNRYFTGNSGGDGGAINARGAGKLIITDSAFRNNKADFKGGAIFTEKDELIISGCTVFENNTARGRGGAIDAESNVYDIDGAYFYKNISYNNGSGNIRSSGGALNFAAGNNANTTLIINQSRFVENMAEDGGGAFYGDGFPITIKNSLFRENSTDEDGGAIWNNANTNLENVSFIENQALNTSTDGNGGAVYLQGIHQHEIKNALFKANEAGNKGGAIRLYNSTANSSSNLTLTNSEFSSNSAGEQGGAIGIYNHGLTTDTALDTNTNVFYRNYAVENGGAIYANLDTNNSNTLIFGESKYVENYSTTENGGAIYLFVSEQHQVQVTNNEFLRNSAITYGGAIAIQDRGTGGAQVDVMTGNNFYANEAAGSTSNIGTANRSDIWIETTSGGNYIAKIANFSDNQLQFDPTVANFPTRGNLNSDGYNLVELPAGNGPGSGNTKSNGISYSHNEKTITVNTCTAQACEPILSVPVAPIVLSAGEYNTNNPDDYSSFTQVAVNPNTCDPGNAEVLFTARANTVPRDDASNNPAILTNPIPELKFTYTVVKTNNLTGEQIIIPNNTLDRATVTAASGNSRVEEISEEIPNNAGANGTSRDIYYAYFLDVKNELEDGFTYSYQIDQVQVIPDQSISNPEPIQTFDYDPNVYYTTILTEFCLCATKPNLGTANIKSTKVGISTLDRDDNNWLTDSNNKLGAYIVLESSSKGFVIPRYNTTAEIEGLPNGNGIGTDENAGVEEGMIVWDNEANCLKMFYDHDRNGVKTWNCVSNDNCTEGF